MDLTYTDDQQEIKRTARDLLTSRSDFAAVRRAAESGTYDESLWSQVVDLGWPGIAIAEEYGGLGLGLVELAILGEELGYAVAASPFAATTGAALMIESCGTPEQKSRWLPSLVSGSATASLAIADGRVAQLVPDADRASVIVLIDKDTAILVERSDATVDVTATIDPTSRYARVSTANGAPMAGSVSEAVDRAEVLVAAQLTGLCQRALDETVAFVKERKQFGTPVGAFQAVSHRCAEMLLETERARSALYFAAWAADAEPGRLAFAASAAKAAACDAAAMVTSSAIQAHGGVGFTWEADMHWLFKRARLMSAQLRPAGEHRARVARLAARRPVPEAVVAPDKTQSHVG